MCSRNTPHQLQYKHFLWIKMNYELQYLLVRCWVWSGMYPIRYVVCSLCVYNNRRHNPIQAWMGNANKWRNLHTNVNGAYVYDLDRYQSSRLSISGMGLVNIHDHLVSKLIFDTNYVTCRFQIHLKRCLRIISFSSYPITNLYTKPTGRYCLPGVRTIIHCTLRLVGWRLTNLNTLND